MKQQLVFATNNPHKIAEVKRQLGDRYTFLSLQEIGCTEEIPETADTLEGNARLKARHVKDGYGYDCFSEDTGLEVLALGHAPGVDTAHYAGPERSATANNQKLLSQLADRKDRLARFRTVICLLVGGEEHLFEGQCEGRIATAPIGHDGFGYDPVFVPLEGDGRSFAQMTQDEKLRFSHRARAMAKLEDYLKKRQGATHPTA
ncbi:XTP/dITP diphosphohydrolase [Lewinella marina]|uniref:dITP/XTP pyrophosphatase n=1 Tax=Neolewinella marina TaxID=438751 RepID=A0A2G0CCG9_9BACT|nr:RdgB/HAM1 family non-canonical purine NTP pyrophosphatase [Neolewinella marina]NJB87641.1 XTP/dITP diphosphohydrolase [Neolewinella marina]PHK97674.1 non-canonical purine NTP pyrophosphatase, RdgB/HAM1 family [Neolewinella marina]